MKEQGADAMLDLLADRCVLVDLHVGQWSAKARWTPEEWSLEGVIPTIQDSETREAFRELYAYSNKYLLPPQIRGRLRALVVQGRKNLYRYAYDTSWGWMVPMAVYRQWKARDDELQAEYLGCVADMCDHLDAHVAEMARRYRRYLQAAVVPTPAWIDSYVRSILDLVPSTEAIRARFSWRSSVKLILLPPVVGAERQNADESQLRIRREIADQMRAEKQAEIDSVMRELVGQFRGHVYDVATQAAASIRRNDGRLVGKVAQQLRNLVQWAREMDVTGDAEIRRALDRLHAQLGSTGAQKGDDVHESLEALSLVTKSTLVELGMNAVVSPALSGTERGARFLGDAPVAPEDLRQARRTLGLDDVPAPRSSGGPVPLTPRREVRR